MSIFGDIEEFISEELYPYRWPILIAMVVTFGVVLVIGFRQRWHKALWSHKAATAIVGVPLLIVTLVAGDYFLSPLFERSLACEASPIATSGAGSEGCEGQEAVSAEEPGGSAQTAGAEERQPSLAASDAPAPEARIVSQGEFQGADDFHFGEGKALLIETAPGEHTLRFEEFSVRNGPDLFVYLSTDATGYTDGSLELGELKATDGAFNYEVPAGTDVSRYQSAIVWCKEFGVLFAAATLASN
jgi:hypothetical protein